MNQLCVASCQTGQLIDGNGVCYWCPINEVIVGGQCVCKAGYSRVGARCELQCQAGQNIINGLCGTCVSGTIYNPQLQSCVCKEGYYKNNYGFCERSTLIPVTCDRGFYHNGDTGCVACPEGCLACSSATQCTECPPFYEPSGSRCIAKCGDGYAVPGK